MVNPKVQITALNQKTEWFRIIGTASLCKDQSVAEQYLANSPFLRKNYVEMGMNLCLFQIDNAMLFLGRIN